MISFIMVYLRNIIMSRTEVTLDVYENGIRYMGWVSGSKDERPT